MSYANKVFDAEELKVMILQQLPMSALLLNQRVCKGWRQTITSTAALQRKLYLEPAKGEPLAFFSYNRAQKKHVARNHHNPKIPPGYKEQHYHLPATAEEAQRLRFMWAPRNGPLVPVEVVENPFCTSSRCCWTMRSKKTQSHPHRCQRHGLVPRPFGIVCWYANPVSQVMLM